MIVFKNQWGLHAISFPIEWVPGCIKFENPGYRQYGDSGALYIYNVKLHAAIYTFLRLFKVNSQNGQKKERKTLTTRISLAMGTLYLIYHLISLVFIIHCTHNRLRLLRKASETVLERWAPIFPKIFLQLVFWW